MSVRNFFLTIVGCSIPIGVVAGVAVDPTMLPRAVHPWQKTDRSPHIASTSYEFTESGPQGMSPWATDRTPTWKRGKGGAEVTFVPIDDSLASPRDQPAVTDLALSAETISLTDAAQPAQAAMIDAQASVATAQAAIESQAPPETAALPALNTD